MGDIQLFVFTVSYPSREVGCVLFPSGFSPGGHEDVYGIRLSQVVGGDVWLDGGLSVAPHTSAWLGETKPVSASWA